MAPREHRLPGPDLAVAGSPRGALVATVGLLLLSGGWYRSIVWGIDLVVSGFLVAGAIVVLWGLRGKAGGPGLLRGLPQVLVLAGLTWLIVQAATRLLLGRLAPPFAGPLASFGFRVLGVSSTVAGGTCRGLLDDELIRVLPNGIALALPALTAGLLGRLLLGWVRDRAWGVGVRTLLGLGILYVFAVFWHVLVVAVQGTTGGFFTEMGAAPMAACVFGPLALCSLVFAAPILEFSCRSGRPGSRIGPGSPRAGPVLFAAAAVAVFSAVTAARLPSPGEPKAGRIVVDDAHVGDWEVAGARFTPAWRGDMSVYSCSAAFEALGDRYLVSVNRDGPLSRDVLAAADILVLKVPDRPFSPEEIEVIHAFVREGGGLLAIGDHTDLFGCNSHLNEVVGRYGIRLEATSVAAIGGAQAGISPGWCAPWLADAGSEITWLTGCEIALTGFGAKPILVDCRAFSDDAVFANSSFFGDGFCEPSERVGPVVLGAEASDGPGRVVVLNDGTVFTNFAVFRPGRFQVLERVLAHLNQREGAGSAFSLIGLAAGLVLVLVCVHNASTPGARLGLLALSSAALVCGWFAGGELAGKRAPSASPLREIASASFLGTHANYFLAPTIGYAGRDFAESYDSLFVEIQRFGIRPRFERDLDTALAQDRVLVVPNVLPVFTLEELDALGEWVRAGGILWVLASDLKGTPDGVEQVATSLGIPSPDATKGTGFSRILAKAEPTEEGTIHVWRVGKGLFCATANGQAFSRRGMGHPFPDATEKTGPKYELVDELFTLWQEHLGITEENRFASHAISGS